MCVAFLKTQFSFLNVVASLENNALKHDTPLRIDKKHTLQSAGAPCLIV